MTKTQKTESLRTKEAPKSEVKINSKGEIAKELDLSMIKPDEIFSYLGEKYVVQLKTTYKLDENGAPLPKEFNTPHGRFVDGYVLDKPKAELFSVKSTNTSSRKTISDFGKPLNVRVEYIGPISAAEVFTVESKPIVYDSTELREKESLMIKQGAFVKQTPA